MSLKDDVKELQTETESIKKQVNNSLAWEIVSDYKKQTTILKLLLGLSIIANIIIALILK